MSTTHASMGPPPFGSGNIYAALVEALVNGSPQWGHRLSAVETNAIGALVSGSLASMGPPPFGSGNRVESVIPLRPMKLQWGHRLSAVETKQPSTAHDPVTGFNGATAFRQWKLLCLTGSRILWLQWGHRRQWNRVVCYRRCNRTPSPPDLSQDAGVPSTHHTITTALRGSSRAFPKIV